VGLASAKTRARPDARYRKRHSHKPLPKEFRRDDFTFRQIVRKKNAAIYEQRWNGSDSSTISYEVIRIRCRAGFHIGGRFVEPAETYPSPESWGTDGFTLTDNDSAFAKLRELIRSAKGRPSIDFVGRTGDKKKRQS
jgi:hypothetical protein